jgi:hypothetical protein
MRRFMNCTSHQISVMKSRRIRLFMWHVYKRGGVRIGVW